MSDLALTWDGHGADLSIEENDLARDDGLETAVLLSLFTDRRADDGDVLPDGETDRRGWWGDGVPVVEGDRTGSRLWLLGREKQTPATLSRAREYALEALQWLIEDKIAASIDVVATMPGYGGRLLTVTIHRPKSGAVQYEFGYTWAAQEARR